MSDPKEIADGFRAVAALIEAHPELADHVGTLVYVPVFTKEAFADLARCLGGAREKYSDSLYMGVQRSFGPVAVRVYVPHNVACERKVVGTETVEIPDPDAPKIIIERDVYEWECPPILNGADT